MLKLRGHPRRGAPAAAGHRTGCWTSSWRPSRLQRSHSPWGLRQWLRRRRTAPRRAGDPANPATVTADALPTVQIDGVVWSQAVVGNTVYAGGQLRQRPPGRRRGRART